MLQLPRTSISALLAASLCCSAVFAANCSSVWIQSEADAEDLRHSCRIVNGHVALGPFPSNETIHHINLDGIEEITGTLGAMSLYQEENATQAPYTVSSSSLKQVDGIAFGDYSYFTRVTNITLPNLASVGGDFWVGSGAVELTYLDITNLESAHSVVFSPPNLTTLHHTGLKNATRMDIRETKISSLDSLTQSPLNLTNAIIVGPFPNVESIAIGFKAATTLVVSAEASITLGGPATTEMTIGKFSLQQATDLKRSKQVETIEIDQIEMKYDVRMAHIKLPFDNLRRFWLLQNPGKSSSIPITNLTLPPAAANWTGGFDLDISNAPNLDLSSIYGTDEEGKTIQTWYWPKSITSIWLADVTVSNEFFDGFIAQQNGSMSPQVNPSVVNTFTVAPAKNSTFSCAPFLELQKLDRLPKNRSFECFNSTRSSSAVSVRASSSFGVLGAVISLGVGTFALGLL